MSKLRAWRTPFESASFPSIWIAAEGHLDGTSVFVKTDRVWKLRFENVFGIKVCDESYDDNTRFHIDRDEPNLCSYVWEDSPWKAEFNLWHVDPVKDGELQHYVLLGGDYNIEVLAIGRVEIHL